jgi:malonyl CoA-acyl carrier protein transacylase
MKVKFMLMESGDPVTRTEAVMLFDHRAAFDMEGCNGYFDLEDIVPP